MLINVVDIHDNNRAKKIDPNDCYIKKSGSLTFVGETNGMYVFRTAKGAFVEYDNTLRRNGALKRFVNHPALKKSIQNKKSSSQSYALGDDVVLFRFSAKSGPKAVRGKVLGYEKRCYEIEDNKTSERFKAVPYNLKTLENARSEFEAIAKDVHEVIY